MFAYDRLLARLFMETRPYGHRGGHRSGIPESGVTVLSKPFTNDELFTAVRTTIGIAQT